MTDHERDCSAEFTDLYVRLLNAALDEKNSSQPQRMRRRYLAAHVVRGILMTGLSPESFPHLRIVRNQELGYGETPVL
jgi:hypothetical protein